MKHKTAELTGPLLDAAVALAEGWAIWRNKRDGITISQPNEIGREHGNYPAKFDSETGARLAPMSVEEAFNLDGCFSPSSDWAQGGPIIERERIAVVPWLIGSTHAWSAHYAAREHSNTGFFDIPVGPVLSPNLLTAAMRAYVASKLGDEVELP